ncbi:hypothetical protein N0V88_001602 [Collariella sp. IMI 366227]|nr:hypothetical protein N0V88_001602 [Collariella sp. IMI 366227]
MATAKRLSGTSRSRWRRPPSLIALLAAPDLLIGGAFATNCRANFLFPTKDLTLFRLDTVNVTYHSDLTQPTLSCWCGAPGRATQKFGVDNVSPLNGSTLVPLNFLSNEPCWFELSSESRDCRILSEVFVLSPSQRPASVESAPIRGTPALRVIPSIPVLARAPTAESTPAPQSDSFNTGAKAALGVGVALFCIAIGAMAAFLYWRRRRRGPDGNILDHDRRTGKKGKKTRGDGSSEASGRSDEPLCPIQPVFDGFPGSTGYDDVRSIHSTLNSHSPTGAQSPTSSQNAFWAYERSIEREELTAARLKSQLQPSVGGVVSYGPNPVTPTLTPRPVPRANVDPAGLPMSASTPDLSHTSMIPLSDYSGYTDYHNFSIPPPTTIPLSPACPHTITAIPPPTLNPPRPRSSSPTGPTK